MATPRQVFVIGDSISMQYGPHLRAALPPNWSYDRKGGADATSAKDFDDPQDVNGGDSSMVLAYLKERFDGGGFRPDVLLLNCGLHDIKHAAEDGPCQVPLKRYHHNLESILMLCKARGLPVVWARTTPVDDDRHRYHKKNFFRFARDVAEYNAVADRLTIQYHVTSIDLHGFTAGLKIKPLYRDHVHFTDEVQRLQGVHIAGYLACWGEILDRRRTTGAG